MFKKNTLWPVLFVRPNSGQNGIICLAGLFKSLSAGILGRKIVYFSSPGKQVGKYFWSVSKGVMLLLQLMRGVWGFRPETALSVSSHPPAGVSTIG